MISIRHLILLLIVLAAAAVRAPGQDAPLPAPVKKEGAIFRVPDNYTLDVALTADGKLLARAGTHETVDLWDVASGKKRHTLEGHTASIFKVAFSPDGKTLASATGWWMPNDCAGEVKLWDVATGKERIPVKGHHFSVRAMAFSADGKTLATSSDYPATVKLWDVATGKENMELGVFAWSLAFSPDGKTLATTLDSVILWDVTTGKKRATFPKTNSAITCVGFTPDGNTLASVNCTRGLDNDEATGKLPLGTLRLWDVATTKERASSAIPVFPGMSFFSLAFTADSKTLISAMWSIGATESDLGLAVQQWELATGKERAAFWAPFNAGSNNAGIYFATLSADGKTVAWGGAEEQGKKITGTAHVWDVQSLAASLPRLPKEPDPPAPK